MVVLGRGDVELASLAAAPPVARSTWRSSTSWPAGSWPPAGWAARSASATPCGELSDLLAFLGLADVVPGADGGRWTLRLPRPVAQALQVVGEAEDGEEGRVEEVVVPDDPVA